MHPVRAYVQEAQVDLFAFEEASLRDKLIHFDHEVIRREYPDTPENRRLLRPAMLEALLEYTPTNRVEFLEVVPSYIRRATEAAEGKYLDQIFDIINASLEETEIENGKQMPNKTLHLTATPLALHSGR